MENSNLHTKNFQEKALSEVLDIKALQQLMDDFYNITKLGVAVTDLNGKILVAVEWKDLCTKFHRVHPETIKNCIESDIKLTENVKRGEFKVYQCKNNMVDVSTPIFVEEKHVGNIFFGQFLFEKNSESYEKFCKQALQYGFDEKAYMEAYEKIPSYSQKEIEVIMKFYAQLADMISKLSYSNYKLAEALTERNTIEEIYQNIIENNPISIQIIDKNGCTIRVNSAHTKLFGSTPPADYSLFNDPQIKKQGLGEFFDRVKKGEIVHFPDASFNPHDTFPNLSDSPVWIRVTAFPLTNNESNPENFVLMHENITEQKKLEKEKENIQTQLLHQEKLASIGTLAAGIAHEINNPLMIIKGFTDIIKKNFTGEEILENKTEAIAILQKQESATDRITNIISGLRTFARTDTETLETIDVHKAINDTINLVKTMLSKEDVTIETEFKCKNPQITATMGKLQQVIMNMITNARDAIKEKNSPGIIKITTEIAKETINISFSDNGIGMDEKQKNNSFDAFYTTKGPGKGTGLGLSISQSIINSFGGSIKVESEKNIGTTFTMCFPKKLKTIEENNRIEQANKEKQLKLKGKVLIIDDEQDIRQILSIYLKSFNLEVVEATDGEDALAKLKETFFDYVISDIKMPNMSGDVLLLNAKKLPHLAKTKFVIITGGMVTDYTKEQKEIIKNNANGYINKPFNQNTIAKLLASLTEGIEEKIDLS